MTRERAAAKIDSAQSFVTASYFFRLTNSYFSRRIILDIRAHKTQFFVQILLPEEKKYLQNVRGKLAIVRLFMHFISK